MRTTLLSRCGSQTSEVLCGGRFGSMAKWQPPTPSERFGGVNSSFRGVNDCPVIALIIRISAQKLPGELLGIKFNHIHVAGRRAPIGCRRHLWSPADALHSQHVVPAVRTWLAIAAECS